MKVMITGGTGLIGRGLARKLADDGAEIVILSRGSRRPEGLPESARIVKWDSKTGSGWSHELEDTDAVVNLAGANLSGGRWTKARKQLIRESRINAGNAVTDAVKTSGFVPRLLIQSSGISYYGDRRDRGTDETGSPGDDFLARVCVEWEQTTAPVEELGTRRVIIRTAPVLNPEEGALPPIALPFHLFAGGRIGSGTQGFSWIHREDAVEAIRFLLQEDQLSGPVNLCSPEPVSNQELAETIGRVMNRPARFPVPGVVMRTLLGEVADTVLLGQYAIPKRLQDAGFTFRFANLEDALRDLIGDESRLPGSRLFRRGGVLAIRLFLP